MCPLHDLTVSGLIKHRYEFLCHENLTTSFLRDIIVNQRSYSPVVVILHEKNSDLIKRVTEQLSACNISFLLLDIQNPIMNKISFSYSNSRTLIIYSITHAIIYDVSLCDMMVQ